jgi:hypothetical protein
MKKVVFNPGTKETKKDLFRELSLKDMMEIRGGDKIPPDPPDLD